MTPVREADYWDYVAGDSRRIETELWSDMNTDACLDMIWPTVIGRENQAFEIGCGVGRLTCPISSMVQTIVGVDVSSRMVEQARRLCANPRTQFVIGDGRTLEPGWSSTFDAGFSMTTFQHIPHDAQEGYLHEIRRVLVIGGRFRLQFVWKAETGPFQYPTPIKDMMRWADDAGLKDIDLNVGGMRPEWCWVTWEKR